jgi:hypothetical protein
MQCTLTRLRLRPHLPSLGRPAASIPKLTPGLDCVQASTAPDIPSLAPLSMARPAASLPSPWFGLWPHLPLILARTTASLPLLLL